MNHSIGQDPSPTPQVCADAYRLITASEFQEILEKNKQNCLFCEPNSSKKIIMETDNFYVTFDDSPLIEGHLLIHTKIHYGCSGEIPPTEFEELVLLKSHISKLLTEIYGRCVFYEHGRAGHCSISEDETLCEHFHLHALPLADNVAADIGQHLEQIKLSNFKQVPEYYERYDQYLLYENDDGTYFYPVLEKIPSHFLRTIIAERIGQPERADWAKTQDLVMLNSVKLKLKDHYAQ